MEELEEDGEKRATGNYLLALVNCPSFFKKFFFCRLRISCHRTTIIITKSDKKTGQRIADDFNRDLIVKAKCPEENTRFLQILRGRSERESARFHHREWPREMTIRVQKPRSPSVAKMLLATTRDFFFLWTLDMAIIMAVAAVQSLPPAARRTIIFSHSDWCYAGVRLATESNNNSPSSVSISLRNGRTSTSSRHTVVCAAARRSSTTTTKTASCALLGDAAAAVDEGRRGIAGMSVVVTRERGKNGKLIKALVREEEERCISSLRQSEELESLCWDPNCDGWMQETLGIQCVEVPLIEHRTGPDLAKLVHILRGIAFFVLHKLVLPFPHERCLLSHHFLFCV
jgi:hypothetical protein